GPHFPIFEATFQYGGVLVRVDALLPEGRAWQIVEVKASTSVKEEHAFDCAVQGWVIQGLGLDLKGISLAYVDNTFVYQGDGDYRGLLIEKDMAEEVEQLMPIIPEWVQKAGDAARAPEPDIPVGQHCFDPYACPFVRHCWPSDTDYPVLGLAGSRAKLAEFVMQGCRDIRDVPSSRLTERQQWIQRVTASGQPELLAGASQLVNDLAYPRYYLDFETIMPPVPIWAGTPPLRNPAVPVVLPL
ncbi:MAG: DUF2779 domain-containing protein, partial [Woeseia sp.]